MYKPLLISLLLAPTMATQAHVTAKANASVRAARPAAPASAGGSATDSTRARAELLSLIGNAACDSDSQCRSLPLGEKACGGPESYLPWSIKTSNAHQVAAWAERYRAAQRVERQGDARFSNCAFLVDPGAVCRAARCVPGSTEIPR